MFFSGAFLDITNSSLACIILPPANKKINLRFFTLTCNHLSSLWEFWFNVQKEIVSPKNEYTVNKAKFIMHVFQGKIFVFQV